MGTSDRVIHSCFHVEMVRDRKRKSRRVLIGWIWSFMKEKGRWPTQGECRVWIHQAGLHLDQIRAPASLPSTKLHTGLLDGDPVPLNYRELLDVKDFRRLAEPAPKVLRLAAAKAISMPPFTDSAPALRGRITRAELLPFWDSELDARWGFRALTILPFQIAEMSLGGGNFGFEPALEHLPYEHVSSFQGALRIATSTHPATTLLSKVSELPSAHRDLLTVILNRLETTGAWPAPVLLSVECRRLGYVPDLLGDLHPAFIPETFERLVSA